MMKRRPTHRLKALFLFLLVIAMLGCLLLDSNTRLVTSNNTLSYSKLPAAFDGYKIVQLSDIHSAVFGKDNSRLIKAVKNAAPDIIVITGDLVSFYDGLDDIGGIIEPLVQSLATLAPVYYVTGNHEWASNYLHQLFDILEQSGVTILRNSYVRLTRGTSSIVLAGLDDPGGPRDMKTPETLLKEIRAREGNPFIVLLAHRNIYLNRFAALDIDLVLCGHAHGGVIRLPFIGELIGTNREFFPEYTAGVFSKNNTKMLVSRGIGNSAGFPRFLNNPEIPVVTLRRG